MIIVKQAVGFLGVCAVIVGCAALQNPTLPGDIASEISCIQGQVEAGNTNFIAVAGICAANEVTLVMDVVEALLASKSWVTQHAPLVPALQGELAKAKAGVLGL